MTKTRKAAGADKLPAAKSTIQARLARLGLRRDIDFVLHLPMRYEDETRIVPIAEARDQAQVEGVVNDCSIQFRPRRQLVVRMADASGELTLRFLNFYGSQTRQFETALETKTRVRVRGEVRDGFFGREMVHPRYSLVEQGVALPESLTPVYPAGEGVGQALLRTAINRALARMLDQRALSDTLPDAIRTQRQLMEIGSAVRLLHHPPPDVNQQGLLDRSHPAWIRIKFDELLAQQISLMRAHHARRKLDAPALRTPGKKVNQFLQSLPFKLTGAQQRVWSEIRGDLAVSHPMQRLLQGDVGSGKTVIAALAALQAIDNGFQAALMAPTEILAEQHFRKLAQSLETIGVSIAWLTGSLKKKDKTLAQEQIESGAAQLVIGTHALIQDGVIFHRLGLAIVDEQHRFGVGQRLALRSKTLHGQPHQLMMSATPIPRTLAMSYYADLDVSSIDEMPPGRKPVVTKLLTQTRRDEVVQRIHAAAIDGQQVYWVCPLIEESEALQLQTAVDTHAALSAALPDLSVGLLHGRMASAEKAEVMQAFVAGTIQVLVATTVIEVGVDVPNASLMVIEHAERFGLSQLHQLRGRVGRGAAESACILLYQSALSQTARARLRIMHETTDGFEIARRDLELRGPGEFLGQRQSGMALLRFADLQTDQWLVEQARDTAALMLREYPEYADLHLQRWMGGREEFLKA